MSKALTSSYPNYGANVQMKSARARVDSSHEAKPSVRYESKGITRSLLFQPLDAMTLGTDKLAAELAIQRVSKEIRHAKEELKELEEALLRDQLTPPAREWLFPLMAIGLAMALYGSFAASNTAELGATGLMLLWSLMAFWYIHVGDKQLENAKSASKAEIEIWTSRIAELQQALEHNKRIVEAHE